MGLVMIDRCPNLETRISMRFCVRGDSFSGIRADGSVIFLLVDIALGYWFDGPSGRVNLDPLAVGDKWSYED